MKNFVSVEKEVKDYLKSNEENFKKFPTITKKIKNIKANEFNINENMSLENFGKIVEDAGNLLISPVTPLKIVLKEINNDISKYSSIDNWVENVDEKLLEMITLLNGVQFKKVIEMITETLDKENSLNKEEDEQRRHSIAIKIDKHIKTDNQRVNLISVITHFDRLTLNTPIKIKF